VVAPVDHKYDPPGRLTVDAIVTELPEQTELVAGIETVGTGFTVTPADAGALEHPLTV
jgi:hypothetical protein